MLTNIPFIEIYLQVKHQTQIKGNHTCKLINERRIITLTNEINTLKIETYKNIVKTNKRLKKRDNQQKLFKEFITRSLP